MTGRRTFAAALDLTGADDNFRARFWSKVDIAGPDECWEWTAYRTSRSYGQFTVRKGFFVTASRVCLAMTTPLKDGEVACHRCDNPPCVNPAHLFVGTQVDNGLDCVKKGRANSSRGEANGAARLTGEDVAFIRAQDCTIHGRKSELARQFGVTPTTIRAVLARRTWQEVA